MTPKEEVQEVPCPECSGKGVFVFRDDLGKIEDWKVCPRCQGAGRIVIKIKHQYGDDE